jgi:hypothetical protein
MSSQANFGAEAARCDGGVRGDLLADQAQDDEETALILDCGQFVKGHTELLAIG